MPTPSKGRLHIKAEGGIPVSEARMLLATVEHAYNSLLILESTAESVSISKPTWIPDVHFSVQTSVSMVLPTNRLVLSAVELSSPGFWEFLGVLNPLETIRKYLGERHERRKDREYREPLEAQKLALENQELANRVIERRIEILKKAAVPDHVIATYINELVHRPLEALGAMQDRGLIIEVGEIKTASDVKAA
jgi:hypothetical protein